MSYRPKLIALDMDGTLLNGSGVLTNRTKAAIKAAREQGIHVTIATGRMYPSALPIILELGIDVPCVFYNGAVIKNPVTHEVLYEKPISEDLTREVLDFYREHGWYLQIYHEDKLIVEDSSDPRCKYYESIAKIDAVALGDDFWDFCGKSDKLLGISMQREVFENMRNLTEEYFGDRLYIAASWRAFVEMVNRDINKALAVKMVAESLGIDREDVMTFGDGGNDKEMLAWAGVGVAMGNAPSYVREAADITAPDNESDGAAEILERYLNL